MIIGSGYDRTVGGSQGDGYLGLPYNSSYGIPIQTWLDFNHREQELFIQDFNRTTAQQNYATDSDYAKVYLGKEYVDNTLVDPIIDTGTNIISKAQETAFKGLEIAVIGIGIAFLLGRK